MEIALNSCCTVSTDGASTSGGSAAPTTAAFPIFTTVKEFFMSIIKFASTIFTSLEEVLHRRVHALPVEKRATRLYAKVALWGTASVAPGVAGSAAGGVPEVI